MLNIVSEKIKYICNITKIMRIMHIEKSCIECGCKENLKGYVKKHVTATRKFLDEGKIEEVKIQLTSLETHLKEIE